MSKLNIYKLFLKFIGGNSIEIKGLYLKPKRILKDVLTIEFSIENPNEISYYIDVVGDYLNNTLFDFGKFTNIMLSHTIEYDGPRLYLNKTLKNNIKSYLNSKKTLSLSSYHNTKVTLTGKSVGFSFDYGYDTIYIWNEFKSESGIVYDTKLKKVISNDLEECIEKYLQIIESDTVYLESEHVYNELDEILSDYPLIDTDWLSIQYSSSFINLS